MTVRARKDLVAARIAMANQLRAQLEHVLPGAIELLRNIDSAITLAFLTRFPIQAKVDWLTPKRLELVAHPALPSPRSRRTPSPT